LEIKGPPRPLNKTGESLTPKPLPLAAFGGSPLPLWRGVNTQGWLEIKRALPDLLIRHKALLIRHKALLI